MKNTSERIEEIIKEFGDNGERVKSLAEINSDILRNQLEALVLQAKLEQLRGDKWKKKTN